MVANNWREKKFLTVRAMNAVTIPILAPAAR
jgi:hypothetical protein